LDFPAGISVISFKLFYFNTFRRIFKRHLRLLKLARGAFCFKRRALIRSFSNIFGERRKLKTRLLAASVFPIIGIGKTKTNV
jgi:hypothetical protein